MNSNILTLEKPLTVYKVIRSVKHRHKSLFQEEPIRLHKFVPCLPFGKPIESEVMSKGVISKGGYHVLTKYEDAKELRDGMSHYVSSELAIMVCIIPTGTKIVRGTFLIFHGATNALVCETYLPIKIT